MKQPITASMEKTGHSEHWFRRKVRDGTGCMGEGRGVKGAGEGGEGQNTEDGGSTNLVLWDLWLLGPWSNMNISYSSACSGHFVTVTAERETEVTLGWPRQEGVSGGCNSLPPRLPGGWLLHAHQPLNLTIWSIALCTASVFKAS